MYKYKKHYKDKTIILQTTKLEAKFENEKMLQTQINECTVYLITYNT